MTYVFQEAKINSVTNGNGSNGLNSGGNGGVAGIMSIKSIFLLVIFAAVDIAASTGFVLLRLIMVINQLFF